MAAADDRYARYEALVTRAAGDPDLFERPRREAALEAKQKGLAEQAIVLDAGSGFQWSRPFISEGRSRLGPHAPSGHLPGAQRLARAF